MPLHRGVSPHPFYSLVARAWRWIRVVVNISRDQYVTHMVLEGEFADSRYCLQPCQLETTHRRIIDEAEDLADLPVGGVNEAECHSASSIVLVPIRENPMWTQRFSADDDADCRGPGLAGWTKGSDRREGFRTAVDYASLHSQSRSGALMAAR